jgi:hypothetical protein
MYCVAFLIKISVSSLEGNFVCEEASLLKKFRNNKGKVKTTIRN